MRLRMFTALALLSPLGAALGPAASASWLSDWFQPAAYEEVTPPAEADAEPSAPVVEEATGDAWTSGSVLLNPPLAVEDGWFSRPGTLPPDAALTGDLPPEAYESYSLAAPPWSSPVGEPRCCEPPTVHYWNHPLLASTLCRCQCDTTVDLVLSVPGGCCDVDVAVCVPACCSDAPAYETDRDWLGRVTHTYCWPCGYQVRIVQLHIGSWVVHTYNR